MSEAIQPAAVDVVDVYRRLLRTTRHLRRRTGALLAESGLTGAQYGTLHRIPSQGITLTALADLILADPGNLSGIVDRLRKEGLLVREPAADDRRSVLIRLTPAGEELVARVAPRHRELVAQLMGPLRPEEQQQLRALLLRLDPDLAEANKPEAHTSEETEI